jgi:hypothetical protein
MCDLCSDLDASIFLICTVAPYPINRVCEGIVDASHSLPSITGIDRSSRMTLVELIDDIKHKERYVLELTISLV